MDVETPLHDKLAARREEHRAIVNFIQYLEEAELTVKNCIGNAVRPEHLISSYFEIDPEAFEAEKEAMLDELRRNQG